MSRTKCAWLPFYMHEWDKYYARFKNKVPLPFMKKLPGEYVNEQVYATFFSDPCGGQLMNRFGQDTFMWSNDYPHAASTVAALAGRNRARAWPSAQRRPAQSRARKRDQAVRSEDRRY